MSTVTNPFKRPAQAANEGGLFTPPPAGPHAGCLVAIVDLGTHTDVYKDEARTTRQVYLVWELVDQQREEDGKNHLIGARYTLSTHPKAGLRIMLEAWRGKGYAENEEVDITASLGKSCLVNVQHGQTGSGKAFAKIKSISALPKAMAASCPKPTYPLICWSFASDDLPPDVSHLPYIYGTPVKDKIEASEEWKKTYLTKPMGGGAGRATAPVAGAGDQEEDPPF